MTIAGDVEVLQGEEENQNRMTRDRLETLTSDTFEALVLKSHGPIAVEFMSYGCSYCGALEPIIQQVAEMIESKGKIYRVNVEEEGALASTYEVRATPTLIMFLNGRRVGRVDGPRPTVAAVLTAVTHPHGYQQ